MDHERYALLDVIGSGGMATVWRAQDTRLGRIVALKRPHPAPPGSAAFTRFAREARAAATVAHPHLVAVYDAGEDETGPYLVMEFVDGPSLADGSPADGAAVLGAQVAAALAVLHQAGIVHGDVKPANILLAADGAKLTDFGIARMVDDTSTLTAPGIALGTPAYAAPETVATGIRHTAADVYALAAVLYELVTGTRWDLTGTTTQVMAPAIWRNVLAAPLAVDPEQRPTAGEFAAQLVDVAGRDDRHAPTTPIDLVASSSVANRATLSTSRRDRRAAAGRWAAAGAALAVIGALGVVAWSTADSDDGVVTAGLDATDASRPSAATAPIETPPTSTMAPTTMAPTTTQPTATQPTATAPPVTTTPISTVDQLSNQLVAVVEGVAPQDLKPKESRAIVERVNDALQAGAAGDIDEAESKLREAAERISKHVDDDALRARAVGLISELSSALGIDPDSTTGSLAT